MMQILVGRVQSTLHLMYLIAILDTNQKMMSTDITSIEVQLQQTSTDR